jgi:hypothetical protein
VQEYPFSGKIPFHHLLFLPPLGLLAIPFYVEFEVLTAVVMKSTNLWDIKPFSPLKVKLTSNGLHSIISRKRVLFNPILDCTIIPTRPMFAFFNSPASGTLA